jgi:hypothetical protein
LQKLIDLGAWAKEDYSVDAQEDGLPINRIFRIPTHTVKAVAER